MCTPIPYDEPSVLATMNALARAIPGRPLSAERCCGRASLGAMAGVLRRFLAVARYASNEFCGFRKE